MCAQRQLQTVVTPPGPRNPVEGLPARRVPQLPQPSRSPFPYRDIMNGLRGTDLIQGRAGNDELRDYTGVGTGSATIDSASDALMAVHVMT